MVTVPAHGSQMLPLAAQQQQHNDHNCSAAALMVFQHILPTFLP
jgi:hypothetical protein